MKVALINRLIPGIFFTTLSYFGFLLPISYYGKISSLIMGASFYMGVMLLGDYLIVRLTGTSLIHNIFKSPKETRSFITISALMGLVFGFVAADLGGLWYFPYWSIIDYIIIGFVLGGWAFYILSMIICYEAVKLVLDKLFSQRKVTGYYDFENSLYSIFFGVGLMCIIIVLYKTIVATKFFTEFTFVINVSKNAYLTWPYWLIAFLGIFFVCEFIEYKKRRSSLLKDTLHGYLAPIISVISVSFILAISNETQNLSVFLWKYANYPWPEMMVLGVPLFIILIWPLSIIFFIQVWRALGTNLSNQLFANDRLD